MHRPARAAAAAVAPVVVAALLTACGRQDSAGPAAAPATGLPTSVSPSTAGEPVPAAPDASGTPDAAGGDTPASAVPSAEPAVPAAGGAAIDGDVDGDGEVDEPRLDGDRLRVALSGGGTLTATVTLDDEPGELAGVVDGDGDGSAEVWVTTVRGASTGFLTPYRVVDGALREVTLDGAPARLGVGGSATHGDGFACDRDTGVLTVTRVSSDDGTAFTGTATTYRWEGAALRATGTRAVRGTLDDEEIGAGYVVACGSLGE